MPTVHYIPMKDDRYRDQSVSIMKELGQQLMNIDCEDIKSLEIRELPCISGNKKGYYDAKENILYLALREQNKTDRFYDKNYILSQAIHCLAHKSEIRHKENFVSLYGQYIKNTRQSDPTFKETYKKEECIYHLDSSKIDYLVTMKEKVKKWYSKVAKSTGEDVSDQSETSHHIHRHHGSLRNKNNEAPEELKEPNPEQTQESNLDSNEESNSNDSDEDLDERLKAMKQQQLKKKQQKAIIEQQHFPFPTNISNTIPDPYTSDLNLQLPNVDVSSMNHTQNNNILHNTPPIGIQPMLKQSIPYKNPFVSETIKLESSPDSILVFRDYYNPFDKDSINPFINEKTKQDVNVDIENEINSISRDYRNIFVAGSVTPKSKPTTDTNESHTSENSYSVFNKSDPPASLSNMAHGLYCKNNRTNVNSPSEVVNENNRKPSPMNEDNNDDEPRPPTLPEFPSIFPPRL